MDKSIMQSLSYRLSHDFCSAHWTRFFSPTSFFLLSSLSDHLNKKWNGLVVVLCAPQTHLLKVFPGGAFWLYPHLQIWLPLEANFLVLWVLFGMTNDIEFVVFLLLSFFLLSSLSDHLNKKWNSSVVVLCAIQTYPGLKYVLNECFNSVHIVCLFAFFLFFFLILLHFYSSLFPSRYSILKCFKLLCALN